MFRELLYSKPKFSTKKKTGVRCSWSCFYKKLIGGDRSRMLEQLPLGMPALHASVQIQRNKRHCSAATTMECNTVMNSQNEHV